jgi:rubrerythrin
LIREAAEEGQEAAQKAFTHARDVESRHAELYKKAINDMIAERDTVYHVCQVCGYIAEDDAPDRCPVCDAIKTKFNPMT